MRRLAYCTMTLLALALLPSVRADKGVGDTRFIGYEGTQNGWPIGARAEVIRDFAVPIYIGLPDRGYTVLGRIYDPRTSGIGIIGRGLAEGLFPERDRQRDCANQARLQGGDAVLITGDEGVVNALGLTPNEIRKTAPLFDYKNKVVLAIKFR